MHEPVTPLQRQALFKAAVVLHKTTVSKATVHLQVSYNHLTLVLAGKRVASRALQERIAAFIGQPRENLFPSP